MPMPSPGRSARGFTNCTTPLNHQAPTSSPASVPRGPAGPSIAHRATVCHGGRMDTPEAPAAQDPAAPGPDAERPVVVDYTGDWPGRGPGLLVSAADWRAFVRGLKSV